MHESTIDRNALEQLRHGIMPWTAVVPKDLDVSTAGDECYIEARSGEEAPVETALPARAHHGDTHAPLPVRRLATPTMVRSTVARVNGISPSEFGFTL